MNAVAFPLPARQELRPHWDHANAVDLPAPLGTPWIAVFDGVAQPYDHPAGGYALFLHAADGTTAYYAHGQADRASGPVKAGQQLGAVGLSGETTGPHLHFAVSDYNGVDARGGGDIDVRAWLQNAPAGAILDSGASSPAAGAGTPPSSGPDKRKAVLVAGGLALAALVLLSD